MKTLLALVLALGACGGIDVPETSPDAVLAPAIDSGVPLDTTAADAWWTADLGQGQCGAGYVQRLYAPNDVAWCEATAADAGGDPCGTATVIGWYRAGLYKCAKVLP